MDKQKLGKLSEREERELDRKLGNFYSLTIFGTVYKINHCLVARCLIGAVLIGMTIHIIWLVNTELIKKQH